jgi:hypothetical protein
MKPKSLAIGRSGPSCSPRYHITDTEGRYWTGCRWSEDRRQAFLFHRSDEVGETLYMLMLSLIPGPVYRFVLPLVVEAKTETPFDLEVLQAWLAKAVNVGIDATHGTGPVPNSMVMIRLDFDQLKEEDV